MTATWRWEPRDPTIANDTAKVWRRPCYQTAGMKVQAPYLAFSDTTGPAVECLVSALQRWTPRLPAQSVPGRVGMGCSLFQWCLVGVGWLLTNSFHRLDCPFPGTLAKKSRFCWDFPWSGPTCVSGLSSSPVLSCMR